MLTARAEDFDKILGLALGAQDSLTSLFIPRERAARVKGHFAAQRVRLF
jgi:DNA-binding response OmpR family regulator